MGTDIARAERDAHIRRDILRFYYSHFEESPTRIVGGDGLHEELGYEEEEVRYVGKRMIDDGVLYASRFNDITRAPVRITAAGIEELHGLGDETILSSGTRYEILELLYEAERESPGAMAGREPLTEAVGEDMNVVDQNVFYLDDKGLVDAKRGAGAPYFYVQITSYGAKVYEAYELHGTEFPGGVTSHDLQQRTIGPDERHKSLNIFRGAVELADTEVILIDAYARQGLYDMLDVVPDGVAVKVLTTEKVVDDKYVEIVQQTAQDRDLEVRYTAYSDWPFHSRYLLRDGEKGWVWDTSFHDAGRTQHTVSEIKPINLRKILSDFEPTWQDAEVIV